MVLNALMRLGINHKEMKEFISDAIYDHFVIEGIQSYNSKQANTVIMTAMFIGRCLERIEIEHPGIPFSVLSPKTVRALVAKTSQASDSQMRGAVIDVFRLYFNLSDEKEVIGSKKAPGPLYGVSKDVWQALGLALAFRMTVMHEELASMVEKLEKAEGVNYLEN